MWIGLCMGLEFFYHRRLGGKNKLLCMSMRCCLIRNKNTNLWKVNAMLWCGHFTFLAILGLQVFVLQIEYKPFE